MGVPREDTKQSALWLVGSWVLVGMGTQPEQQLLLATHLILHGLQMHRGLELEGTS